MNNQSVTLWIEKLKQSDPQAAQQIWERFFDQLVRLARSKMRNFIPRGADEEDVALSAFDSFFGAVEKGRFPQLNDRSDLWQILLQIASWKVSNLKKKENAAKRGGGKVRRESAQLGSDAFSEISGDEPSPLLAATVAEEYDRLLSALEDELMQKIAVWKMEGYSNREIAKNLDCSVRTIDRKLEGIRLIWSERLRAD